MGFQAVIGSGPLGVATARVLQDNGHEVRVVSRNRPAWSGIDWVRADASVPADLSPALRGAAAVYHCANAPYNRWGSELPAMWRGILKAAAENGARLVVGTNVYAYGIPEGPMGEDHGISPCSRKGRVRALLESEVMEAHASGTVEAVLVRGSDFFGPGVKESVLGDRFFGPVLKGKAAVFYGNPSSVHTYTYLPDFARAMAAAGAPVAPAGVTLHVPSAQAVSGNRFAEMIGEILGRTVAVRVMKRGVLSMAGLFIPGAREMIEMLYEFDRDFVVSSERSERILGVEPTDLEIALRATIEWRMRDTTVDG